MTTTGLWHAEPYEHEEGHTAFMVIANGAHHAVADLGPLPEAEANAHLIALAGNLAQKYSLDKLEAAVERLRKAWDSAIEGEMPLAVDDFLTAITRQPAGDKQQTS